MDFPLYLSGVTNDRIEPQLIVDGIGLMVNTESGYHKRVERYPFWASDLVGMHNNADPDKGIAKIESLRRDNCLFITAPDAYPDALESFERGLGYADLIRSLDYPVAVVAQDGAENLPWEQHWDDFDVLFIGGVSWEDRGCRPSEEWKESEAAMSLARRARNAGRWIHVGRVNGPRRTEVIRRHLGDDKFSCDGTFIKWRKRRCAGECDEERHSRGEGEIKKWLTDLAANPILPVDRLETPTHPLIRKLMWS